MRLTLLRYGWLGLFGVATACGGGGEGRETGPIEFRLVDAPADDVTEIVVTIDEVKVHAAGTGWTVLSSETRTVDLLKLQGGSYALLGVSSLPAGHISQMRLHVKEGSSNYVTTPDGVKHPLKTPSGEESGLKIKIGADFAACETGNLTIDFDGKKSIFVHPKGAGAGDEWILRPVIRLKSVRHKPGTCGDGSPGADAPQNGPKTDGPKTDGPKADGPKSKAPKSDAPPSGEAPPSPAPESPPAVVEPSPPAVVEPSPPAVMEPLPPDTSDPCGPANCPIGNVCIDGVCGVL